MNPVYPPPEVVEPPDPDVLPTPDVLDPEALVMLDGVDSVALVDELALLLVVDVAPLVAPEELVLFTVVLLLLEQSMRNMPAALKTATGAHRIQFRFIEEASKARMVVVLTGLKQRKSQGVTRLA